MYLTHLSLTNFRIFSRLDGDIPRGALLLVGDNAQGKTTLLEAIYMLASMTSIQAGTLGELVNFLAAKDALAVSRIKANYIRGDQEHHLEVRIIQDTSTNGNTHVRKEVLLDGRKRKLNEVIGHFNAVLFLPHMLEIITGSPRQRRDYLDLALAQVVAQYSSTLSAYNKAIRQRNALLKQLKERGGDPDQLAYWDEKTTQTGAKIIHARIHALRELETHAATIHHDLTRGKEILRLRYQPAYEPLPTPSDQYSLPLDVPVDRSGIPLEDIRSGFREKLLELRREEIKRGVTTIGPHRDELHFLGNGIDLGTYGSRGQIRTALLAIKMAEVAWMKEKTGHWPVLLLDEILAELDETRRQDLLDRIAQTEQVLLTTTDLDLFTSTFIQETTQWYIEGGRVMSDE
ncbi:MAG: DNA replication and repair protein RecF [Chloroflexi bacterium]|nr:DNA replication and repair protein RecF [Chloroflexota bacterium]